MDDTGVDLADRPVSNADIATCMFCLSLDHEQLRVWQPYFDYYNSEIALLYAGLAEQSRQITTLPVTTCEDIFHVVKVLQVNLAETRGSIRRDLAARFPSADQIQLDRAINLGIRLWLMVNTQDAEFETLRNESALVSWDEEVSLQTLIDSLFPSPRWELNPNTSRLGPYFTAAFMKRVCGLRLKWTTSICDHLEFDHSKKTLKVFAFKCHIEGLLACHQTKQPVPIPRTVLQETVLSLNLLFPIWDNDTIALLKEENQTFHMHGMYSSRAVSLLDFDHWRDRLLELQDVLQAPPVSWAQLWRDRRNPQQFWTFWIALVILLLTLVSVITSCIQAWASVKALDTSRSR